MSYVSENELPLLELFNLRAEYLNIFKDFKKEYLRFFKHYNKIHESFYGDFEDFNFLVHSPNDCNVEVMFNKIKELTKNLKDFDTFVKL